MQKEANQEKKMKIRSHPIKNKQNPPKHRIYSSYQDCSNYSAISFLKWFAMSHFFFFFSVAKEDKKNVYSRFQVQIYNSVSPWSPYAAHSILFGFLDHNLAIRLKWYSFHCSQVLLIFPSLQWLLSLNTTVWIVISTAKQRKKMKKYELNIMNHREKSVSKYYIFQT